MLSAAHCFGSFAGRNVFVGGSLRDGRDALETRYATEELRHPNYIGYFPVKNDFMLVKLEEGTSNVPYSDWNTDSTTPSDGDSVTVIGFGTTEEGGGVSNVLLETELTVVDFETCIDAYGAGVIFDDIMICAYRPYTDSCQGDSGGPLLAQDGTVVGIVSWGTSYEFWLIVWLLVSPCQTNIVV